MLRERDPWAGRILTSQGSMGSPSENVRAKIPVIEQTRPEIIKAVTVLSGRLMKRAIVMKTAAAARRRMPVIVYLFSFGGFMYVPAHARVFQYYYRYTVLSKLNPILQQVNSQLLVFRFLYLSSEIYAPFP
jgi:hypothetical protein